jgi:hypothetical protein
LVVTSGRATSQAVSTMLDSMTSAPASTGVEPLSLSDDFQQLAGHCTATTANGQPPRLLLVEYGQASCFAFCMLSASPLPPYISVVAYSQVTVWTRGVGSWLVERLGSCGPALPPAEHPLDASSAASSPRRSEDHRVDSIKRSLDTLCPSSQCRRKDAPYHRLYTSRNLAATNEVTGMAALVKPSNSQNRSPFTHFPR